MSDIYYSSETLQMNRLLKITVCCLLLAGAAWLGWLAREMRGWPLPSVREMQERVGCTKIDGRLGPCWEDSETQKCWHNEYLKEHKRLMY